VVAATLEIAQHAASLVKIAYTGERPATDMADAAGPPNQSDDYQRGNADEALAASQARLERIYRINREHHNPMETHATIARWDGDRLTVWDKTQDVLGTKAELAAVLGIAEDSIRCISPFVGGGFGGALRDWPHVALAALTAREVLRPVKLMLTRKQMYTGTGYRAACRYELTLGSDQRGHLIAAIHEMQTETSTYENFTDGLPALGRMLYAVPNVRQTYRTVPLDVNTPTWMRGPGVAVAAFAIESAMDELAYDLGIDPIELRLRNEPDRDPGTGAPFSTRRLPECFRVGARAFGWTGRDPKPRSTRNGDWLIGTGVAAACFDTLSFPTQALARLEADGTALVQTASSDMGPGTYTSMTQVAADALGLTMRKVRFQLGDSDMPPAPPHGGSMTMASVGSAIQTACDMLRQQVIRMAVDDPGSPLHGVPAEDVVIRDGRLHVSDAPVRGETYQRLLARNNRTHLEARGGYTPAAETRRHSIHAGHHCQHRQLRRPARLPEADRQRDRPEPEIALRDLAHHIARPARRIRRQIDRPQLRNAFLEHRQPARPADPLGDHRRWHRRIGLQQLPDPRLDLVHDRPSRSTLVLRRRIRRQRRAHGVARDAQHSSDHLDRQPLRSIKTADLGPVLHG
jgi:xanthine dehydrogenase YagR molybdenum-binding subunit